MGRLLPLVVYLPAGIAVVVGIHYYLWARLVRDVGFAPMVVFGLKALLMLLAASIPVGVIASRLAPYRWSVWWLEPIYLWLGTSLLLALTTAAMGLLPVTTFRASSAIVVLVLGLGAAAWAVHEARSVRVERVEIPLRKLPRALDVLRIVQLADLHIWASSASESSATNTSPSSAPGRSFTWRASTTTRRRTSTLDMGRTSREPSRAVTQAAR